MCDQNFACLGHGSGGGAATSISTGGIASAAAAGSAAATAAGVCAALDGEGVGGAIASGGRHQVELEVALVQVLGDAELGVVRSDRVAGTRGPDEVLTGRFGIQRVAAPLPTVGAYTVGFGQQKKTRQACGGSTEGGQLLTSDVCRHNATANCAAVQNLEPDGAVETGFHVSTSKRHGNQQGYCNYTGGRGAMGYSTSRAAVKR